nr:MAG TPA: hypothetical protein [Caudoviricetes sp.]
MLNLGNIFLFVKHNISYFRYMCKEGREIVVQKI